MWSLHGGAKKLHPFYFLNNFVKSRSMFGEQIPEWICNKTMTKLSNSPNEYHQTTLWNRTCVKLFITTVMQALNVITNWQLRTNASQQMFKVFVFEFEIRIKTIWPLINCWSVTLCSTQLTPVRDVSSGLLAEGLCAWCVSLTTEKCQFPSLSDGYFCVSLVHPPDCMSTKSLTASIFSTVRDVRGLPLPGCPSAVPVSRSF